MPADSRTISRRRFETADFHATKPEHAQANVEDSVPSQGVPARSDAGWMRSAMVAQFSLCTQLAEELNAHNPSHYFTARATQFQQSSDASRYIDETFTELEMNPSPYDTVEVLSVCDIAFGGDRTSAYAYTFAMSDYVASSGVAVLIQEGSTVYEFEVEGAEAPEMATVHAAIEEMLNCVQEGSESTFPRH